MRLLRDGSVKHREIATGRPGPCAGSGPWGASGLRAGQGPGLRGMAPLLGDPRSIRTGVGDPPMALNCKGAGCVMRRGKMRRIPVGFKISGKLCGFCTVLRSPAQGPKPAGPGGRSCHPRIGRIGPHLAQRGSGLPPPVPCPNRQYKLTHRRANSQQGRPRREPVRALLRKANPCDWLPARLPCRGRGFPVDAPIGLVPGPADFRRRRRSDSPPVVPFLTRGRREP